jgi:hypothetical protein
VSRHHESDPTRRQCGAAGVSSKKVVIEYLPSKGFERLLAVAAMACRTILPQRCAGLRGNINARMEAPSERGLGDESLSCKGYRHQGFGVGRRLFVGAAVHWDNDCEGQIRR